MEIRSKTSWKKLNFYIIFLTKILRTIKHFKSGLTEHIDVKGTDLIWTFLILGQQPNIEISHQVLKIYKISIFFLLDFHRLFDIDIQNDLTDFHMTFQNVDKDFFPQFDILGIICLGDKYMQKFQWFDVDNKQVKYMNQGS